MKDPTRLVLLSIQRNIEVVLQFLILGFAIFGLVLGSLEAIKQGAYGSNVPALKSSSEIRMAAFGVLAGYLGLVALIMLAMPFVNDKFRFVPPGPQWGFPVMAVGVTAALAAFIVLKTFVLERMEHVDESAVYVLKGLHTMQEVRASPTLGRVNVFSTGRTSALDGFSFSMWLGLANTQAILGEAADKFKIPLVMRGVPKLFTYLDPGKTPAAQPADIIVKSPVIYMVMRKAGNPYFEIDFNHMELSFEADDGDDDNDVGCAFVDNVSARCRLLDKDTPELESQSLLVKEVGPDRTVLHHVAFVFQEVYRTNLATNKKELVTEMRLYVNGKHMDAVQHRGQIRQLATYVGMFPEVAFKPAAAQYAAQYASLLSASHVADVRFFSYGLEEKRIKALYTEGYTMKG